jgi:hypothetical protein
MVRELAKRGVTPEEVVAAFPIRKTTFIRSVAGTVDSDELESQLVEAYTGNGPKFTPKYWFVQEPIHCNGRTYCVHKFWGKKAFGRMHILEKAFAQHGLKVRPASDEDKEEQAQ